MRAINALTGLVAAVALRHCTCIVTTGDQPVEAYPSLCSTSLSMHAIAQVIAYWRALSINVYMLGALQFFANQTFLSEAYPLSQISFTNGLFLDPRVLPAL
jgi:hypothetical protein